MSSSAWTKLIYSSSNSTANEEKNREKKQQAQLQGSLAYLGKKVALP